MKPEERAGMALDEAAAGLDAHRFAHEAMATVFEVFCVHDDASYARQAAQATFDLVDRLELEQSRFIANSDVSRINALAAGQTTRVSPSTMECLEIAWRMHAVTGGAFDISIGSGLEHLELVPDAFAVRAHGERARLDLGGTARATRSIAWGSCWRSGRSGALSSTGASARFSPGTLPRAETGGLSP